MKPGSIIICRGKSIISKAILTFTKGKWSHAAIYASVWDTKGVIEAQSNGTNFKLWDVWVIKWGYKYEIFEPDFYYDEKALMLRAFSKCGETKYDYFTFFRRAFGSRKERSERREEKKMICSEYVAWVWQLPDGHDITPQELYVYLVNSKDWKEYIHGF